MGFSLRARRLGSTVAHCGGTGSTVVAVLPIPIAIIVAVPMLELDAFLPGHGYLRATRRGRRQKNVSFYQGCALAAVMMEMETEMEIAVREEGMPRLPRAWLEPGAILDRRRGSTMWSFATGVVSCRRFESRSTLFSK